MDLEQRTDREFVLMRTAQLYASRSTCLRAQVGAILARDGRIISTGYNGAPSGISHCSEGNGCMIFGPPCIRTVHAEANCIAYAAKWGISTDGAWLYTTHSPCNDCAKLLINAGIARVVYLNEYRYLEPLEFLMTAGVICEKSTVSAL
jgi:dCMP deaminase